MELSEYETMQLQNELNRRGYWVLRQGLHSYSPQELRAELSRRQSEAPIAPFGGAARDLRQPLAEQPNPADGNPAKTRRPQPA